MRKELISFSETGKFSRLFTDYIKQEPTTTKYYNKFHSTEGMKQTADNYATVNRAVLHQELQKQYEGIDTHESVNSNINLLNNDNTFTVTTGHQLQLMTGPLFFIYKIVTTINLCKELSKKYPEHNYVPVFWMASEDHDFAEINHFNLFGKTHVWDSKQTGAVGEFNTEDLAEFTEEWADELDTYKEIYLNSSSLAEATLTIVNNLFGKYGLVILDANTKSLKTLFKPILEKELKTQFAINEVTATSEQLIREGYKAQVTPRDINLFYLKNGVRERIIKEDKIWKVNNTSLEFTEEELDDLLENSPEVFSPNVILRPVYQQMILPNVSYVGGPGELIYWLQLKTMFAKCDVDFPVLSPRNFCLYVNKPSQKKLNKLGLKVSELFQEELEIKNRVLSSHSDAEFELESEKSKISSLFTDIITKGTAIDATLKGFIEGEYKRIEKQLDNIERKFKKAEERKLDGTITQALGLKNKLFPKGGLQERHDNLFSILINNPTFIEELIEQLDPLQLEFNVVYEN